MTKCGCRLSATDDGVPIVYSVDSSACILNTHDHEPCLYCDPLREQVASLTRGTELLTAALEEKEREILRCKAALLVAEDYVSRNGHSVGDGTRGGTVLKAIEQVLTPPERKEHG